MKREPRRGFALLAVISVMVGVAVLGAELSDRASNTVGAARNRVNLARSAWLAEGCLERARAAIGAALEDVSAGSSMWRALDSVVAASPFVAGCSIELQPAGMRLDVNSATESDIHRLLEGTGESSARADSVTDALLDWRDEDDEPRPNGAERSWYENEHRSPPRNGGFASEREMRLVRGLESASELDSLLGVERERIWLARAPLPVIATLPGITAEALARIAELREAHKPLSDLAGFADDLSARGREALLAHYAELVGRTTMIPEAWMLTARATVGSPAVASANEVRLVRAGTRAAIVRRRTWP